MVLPKNYSFNEVGVRNSVSLIKSNSMLDYHQITAYNLYISLLKITHPNIIFVLTSGNPFV